MLICLSLGPEPLVPLKGMTPSLKMRQCFVYVLGCIGYGNSAVLYDSIYCHEWSHARKLQIMGYKLKVYDVEFVKHGSSRF